ncbi:MAG: alpha-1,4-glucan--maltose-1-phosphate maltosyltransferase [Dehalococcoidia bacterium]
MTGTSIRSSRSAGSKMAGDGSNGLLPAELPSRVIIGALKPEADGGRFPVKRCVGDTVTVAAQVVADGHDVLSGVLKFRKIGQAEWQKRPLSRENPGLDRWTADFVVDSLGDWEFTVSAWVDEYLTWLHGFEAKVAAGQDVAAAREQGARLLDEAASSAKGEAKAALVRAAKSLRDSSGAQALTIAAAPALIELVRESLPVQAPADGPLRTIMVDPLIARFGAWYEFFPRSTGEAGKHGTFKTSLDRLKYAAEMGFDVVYLPPIHPIGRVNRKGPNNSVESGPNDPGSPWAIGAKEGGHRAIHPQLGTLADFKNFVAAGRKLGVEVAIDLAFQCAPDHPLVSEHPEWFKQLPDGSIAYAENPPKRYEDIVPFNFECEDWEGLWQELLETTLFWVDQGVRIFRVDNPHTKPLPFWEWMIARVRAERPDVVFLAEAFARPALLHGLALRGFNQSYTYFAWRNTRDEIRDYLTELTRGSGSEYLRPNLWPNTPDILTEYLQAGARPAAIIRFILAATLSASYGIYGPTFELCQSEAVRPGSEEYRDSEKYEICNWDVDSPWSLREIIKRVNAIRHREPALQRNDSLVFHATSNDRMICYSKSVPGSNDLILVVVNLDPHHRQAGTITLDDAALGLQFEGQYLATDLLAGGSYVWEGRENYVELDPHISPAHVFGLRRHRRTERDFDYFF